MTQLSLSDFDPARFARRNLIDGVLRPNGITEPRLLAALANLSRHAFVPHSLSMFACSDAMLEIGANRFMLSPLTGARLIQAMDATPDDIVLEIGCVTGYTVAVLARLCSMVIGLEQDPELARAATETLAETGTDNAAIFTGPHSIGVPEQGPYDAILIHGAVAEVPLPLLDQLKIGASLVTVLAPPGSPGRIVRATRTEEGPLLTILTDANAAPCPGFSPSTAFEF
ncbi:MAG: protein-L-isoaspartate O-methyltransferase [Pseudomonadota bacterium]|nr:protein-L-isoaspartate O-methyltransferase [Pseudomonadota bacterium]